MVAEILDSGVTETAEPSLYVGANTAGGACDISTAAGSPGTLRSLTDDHLPCVGPSVDNSLGEVGSRGGTESTRSQSVAEDRTNGRWASAGPTARQRGTLQWFTGDPRPGQLNRGVGGSAL